MPKTTFGTLTRTLAMSATMTALLLADKTLLFLFDPADHCLDFQMLEQGFVGFFDIH